MNVTTTTHSQVAEFLKVAKELVLEVREWASVLWVKVQGMRPRFVSKKVIKMSTTPHEAYAKAVEIGCNIRQDHWTPDNTSADRIILRRETKEQLAILKDYGFNDQGVFWVRQPEAKKEQSLDELYQSALDADQCGCGFNYEKIILLAENGYNVAKLGYGHLMSK